jgi:hypothetical protein
MIIYFQKVNGADLCSKIDTNKPVGKAVKLVQNYLSNPFLYNAEKLQKSLKNSKSEFLRLLALYPKVLKFNLIFNLNLI